MRRYETLSRSTVAALPHHAALRADEGLGIDFVAFVSSFMIAAQSLGIATIARAALASQSGFLRAYFDIGETRRVVYGISSGHEDAAYPANRFRTGRADPDEIPSGAIADTNPIRGRRNR
jgi:hypothetical protein